jgi:beta-lactamase regulating signal transducer with metallopeptidase domain
MNLLYLTTAVALLGWFSLLLSRHWSPIWQQRLLNTCLLSVLIIPLLYLMPYKLDWPADDQITHISELTAPDMTSSPVLHSTDQTQRTFTNSIPEPAPVFVSPQFWLMIWLSGVFIQVLRHTIQTIRLYRIRSQAKPCGEHHGLALHSSSLTQVPLLCAIGKTSILLPTTVASWPMAQRTVVLDHELCHYQRKDHWWLWLSALAQTLHWFNPLITRLCQRHRDITELACDQQVLSQGTDPVLYAESLLACVHSSRQWHAHAMSGSASQVQQRIRALADVSSSEPKMLGLRLFLLSGLVLLSGCVNWQSLHWVSASQLITSSQTDLPSIRRQNPPPGDVHIAVLYDGLDFGQTHVRLKLVNEHQQSWLSLGPLQKFDQYIHTWHISLQPGSRFTGEYEVIGVEPDGMVDGVALGMISTTADGRLLALQSSSPDPATTPNFICSWPLGLFDEEFIAALPQLTVDNPDSAKRLLCGAQLVNNGVHHLN